MRPILLADLIAAARCLALLPATARTDAAKDMFCRAHMADLVMKRLRRPHPDWGNGSLMTVTAGMAQTHEPFLSDPDFADALLRLLQHQNNRLAEHRKKKNGPSGWKNWRKRYMISQEIKYEAKDGTDTTPSCKR